MTTFHKAVRRFCMAAIGLVFFCSGVVKIIDPVGSRLIVEEYLKFLHMGFMAPLAGALGVALPLLEAVVGAALLAGAWRRTAAVAAGLLTLFFTTISVLLVVFNPSMSCGCFGEALPLTHQQTLWKNIILVALWCLAYIPFIHGSQKRTAKQIAFWVVVVLLGILSTRSILSLPVVDFTAFTPGADLYNTGHDDMQADTDDFLAADFYSTEQGPILSFADSQGNYQDSLALNGKVLAVSVYDPSDLKAEEWQKLSSLLLNATMEGYETLLLACGTPEQLSAALEDAGQEASFTLENSLFFSDYKTLITLNRSNGGATFISDGTIIQKWAYRLLPSQATLHRAASDDPIESMLKQNAHGRLVLESVAGYSIAALLLL